MTKTHCANCRRSLAEDVLKIVMLSGEVLCSECYSALELPGGGGGRESQESRTK